MNHLVAPVLALVLLAVTSCAEESRERKRERVFEKALEIQAIVEDIRGLEFRHPVEMNLMNRQEFREFAERKMEEELPEGYLESYQLAYGALGLLPRDYDVKQGMLDMLEAGVAGLYDEKDKKLYVFEDVPLDGNTEITLAHELCHALEDQHFDLGALLDSAEEADNEDVEFALRGLVEGTATVLMGQYQAAARISLLDLMAGQLKMASEQLAGMPSVPLVMVRELTLPYTAGMKLVNRMLGRRSGSGQNWRKIDEVFRSALPVSSEQVLHPKRYPDDLPVAIDVGDLERVAGEGWAEIWRNTLGEMRFAAWVDTLRGRKETMLTAQLARGYNTESTGWGGDRYVVLQKGERLALAMVSVWDREEDAREVYDWYRQRGFARKFPQAEVTVEVEGVYVRLRDGDRSFHLELDGDSVLLVEGLGEVATDDVLVALAQARISTR